MAEPGFGQTNGRPTVTRRRFIQAIGAVGGTAAIWSAMSAWGHIADTKAAPTAPPPLEGGGNGTKVIVLGGGPAGLTAGYELGNKGYDVQILEADERVGGHVFTVRNGRRTHELGGEEQVCDFDGENWVDLGAWRLPYTHRAVHHYLSEFRIPCIHHTDINLNAFVYRTGITGPLANRPVRIREALIDMWGYSSELLAKALNQELLDTPLTDEDRDAFIDYLIEVGLLSRSDLSYGPNSARGWSGLEGAGNFETVPTAPFALQDVLPLARAVGDFTPFTNLAHQPVMLKAAKGMSQIYEEGFQPRLADRLHLNAEVKEVRQTDSGVEVVYLDKESGETQSITADYCVSTIPLSVFQQLPRADISNATLEAMRGASYQAVGKMGLQFKRRFWEEDDWIYGGITSTDIPEIGTISYPTWDYHQEKGVIQAYYNFGVPSISVSRLSLQDRIELALEHGSKIHPQMRDEFETGFSVAWHRMPYALGGWANWSTYGMQHYYPRLMEPDGRIYFAGDFLSHLAGWMEGAIGAAWLQIEKLHQRVASGA